jgi:hypothetical protein
LLLLLLLLLLLVVVIAADDAWFAEMATSLSKQLRRLSPADCLAAVEAYSTWCTARQQQQQQQQQDEEGAVPAAVHSLAAGLLVQMSTAVHSYTALQLCTAVSSIAVQMGFKPDASRVQDAAATQGLRTLLDELSHGQVLADVPLRQVLALLQGVDRMQVQVDHAFTAAVQRDALQPRLKQLKPQQFADVALSFVGLRVQLDKEVLDGFWQEVEEQVDQLTGRRLTNPFIMRCWQLTHPFIRCCWTMQRLGCVQAGKCFSVCQGYHGWHSGIFS